MARKQGLKRNKSAATHLILHGRSSDGGRAIASRGGGPEPPIKQEHSDGISTNLATNAVKATSGAQVLEVEQNEVSVGDTTGTSRRRGGTSVSGRGRGIGGRGHGGRRREKEEGSARCRSQCGWEVKVLPEARCYSEEIFPTILRSRELEFSVQLLVVTCVLSVMYEAFLKLEGGLLFCLLTVCEFN